METLVNWVLVTLSVLVTAYVLPGVEVSGFLAALLVALLLGILNAIIKPLLLFLTLPINILTLGLFTLVVNALIILIASALAPGFKVDGFWWALLFSIILSVIVDVLEFIF
ncbi:MAG: phage holin family protein [Candidatus Nealsonbacteria bacterium]|nr:phage holin family protein [Candidatus Nealsonbacteria bacterium]